MQTTPKTVSSQTALDRAIPIRNFGAVFTRLPSPLAAPNDLNTPINPFDLAPSPDFSDPRNVLLARAATVLAPKFIFGATPDANNTDTNVSMHTKTNPTFVHIRQTCSAVRTNIPYALLTSLSDLDMTGPASHETITPAATNLNKHIQQAYLSLRAEYTNQDWTPESNQIPSQPHTGTTHPEGYPTSQATIEHATAPLKTDSSTNLTPHIPRHLLEHAASTIGDPFFFALPRHLQLETVVALCSMHEITKYQHPRLPYTALLIAAQAAHNQEHHATHKHPFTDYQSLPVFVQHQLIDSIPNFVHDVLIHDVLGDAQPACAPTIRPIIRDTVTTILHGPAAALLCPDNTCFGRSNTHANAHEITHKPLSTAHFLRRVSTVSPFSKSKSNYAASVYAMEAYRENQRLGALIMTDTSPAALAALPMIDITDEPYPAGKILSSRTPSPTPDNYQSSTASVYINMFDQTKSLAFNSASADQNAPEFPYSLFNTSIFPDPDAPLFTVQIPTTQSAGQPASQLHITPRQLNDYGYLPVLQRLAVLSQDSRVQTHFPEFPSAMAALFGHNDTSTPAITPTSQSESVSLFAKVPAYIWWTGLADAPELETETAAKVNKIGKASQCTLTSAVFSTAYWSAGAAKTPWRAKGYGQSVSGRTFTVGDMSPCTALREPYDQREYKVGRVSYSPMLSHAADYYSVRSRDVLDAHGRNIGAQEISPTLTDITRQISALREAATVAFRNKFDDAIVALIARANGRFDTTDPLFSEFGTVVTQPALGKGYLAAMLRTLHEHIDSGLASPAIHLPDTCMTGPLDALKDFDVISPKPVLFFEIAGQPEHHEQMDADLEAMIFAQDTPAT